MNKFLFGIILFFFTPFLYANTCTSNMYTKIAFFLKQHISQLSWVDINPLVVNQCNFVIRYYLCNPFTQQQIDNFLPEAIHYASKHCSYVSQGTHQHTEGYCTLTNVVARCEK